jgi:hypothetical protein
MGSDDDNRIGPDCGVRTRIQGQVLRRTERREVAIFLVDGALWVADFIDGRGELIDAATWIRFNCGSASIDHAYRRMALESALPLSEELVARIETLLRQYPDANPVPLLGSLAP